MHQSFSCILASLLNYNCGFLTQSRMTVEILHDRSFSKNPVNLVGVQWKGVVSWSDMAHSSILGLVNLTCFASSLIFVCVVH